MQLPKVNVPFVVTILLLPVIYFTVYEVLTGQFSNDIKGTVVGTVVGSLLGAIYGYWLNGVHPAPGEKKDAAATETQP